MPDESTDAAAASQKIQKFMEAHQYKGDESEFMANEATQLAIASGAAKETMNIVLADRQYFKEKDITAPYLNLATVLEQKEVSLSQAVWAGEDPLNAVIAVCSSAFREGKEMYKLLAAQYKEVNLTMIVFTSQDRKLHEGGEFLIAQMPMGIDTISKLGRALSMKSGTGHMHAWIVDSTHETRLNPFAGKPKMKIITLLPQGVDPMRLFAKVGQQTQKIALAINNKHLDAMVKDLGIDEGLTAICPGPHPTQTSWVIFNRGNVTKDALDKVETQYYSKENFAKVPWAVQQGALGPCEIIAEVWITRKMQSHQTLTTFWATLNYHVQQMMDQFQQAPKIQYEATNKLRLGFPKKSDADMFIAKGLPPLKELGMAFKTEGTKADFWDREGSTTASARSGRSWATAGSKATSTGDDHVAMIDMPEYLTPAEVLEVVKQVMASKKIPVDDTKIELQRLKWSMGSIRQPNWSVKAPGIKALVGATLTLTAEAGHQTMATIRAYADWEKAYNTWQNRDEKKPEAASAANQAKPTPSSLLRNTPTPSPQPVNVSMIPHPPPQTPTNLPNVLHGPAPGQMFYAPNQQLTPQNLEYLQALLSQSTLQSPQPTPSGQKPMMMQLDIASVRGKRARDDPQDDVPTAL